MGELEPKFPNHETRPATPGTLQQVAGLIFDKIQMAGRQDAASGQWTSNLESEDKIGRPLEISLYLYPVRADSDDDKYMVYKAYVDSEINTNEELVVDRTEYIFYRHSTLGHLGAESFSYIVDHRLFAEDLAKFQKGSAEAGKRLKKVLCERQAQIAELKELDRQSNDAAATEQEMLDLKQILAKANPAR